MKVCLILSTIMLHLIGGCAANQMPRSTDSVEHAAVINHVVFIKLDDSSHAAKLMKDCDRLLPTIPVVRGYWCGQHGDFGRGTVDGEYDVGLYVGFASGEDYAEYVSHPNHVELVESWKPHMEWLRVHDIVDNSR